MAYIYILIDPVTDRVRYVGKTLDPKVRLSKHISVSKRCTKSLVKAWIRSLLNNRMRPIMVEIDFVEDFEYWEMFYIGYFRCIGCDLLNMTVGGENPPIKTGIDNCMNNDIVKEKMKFTKASKIKPIYQFSKNGELVSEWKNINHILLDNVSYDKRKIQRCCSVGDQARIAHGFMWSYDSVAQLSTFEKGKMVLNIETGVYYPSAKEAGESLGIKRSTILNKLNKKHIYNMQYV